MRSETGRDNAVLELQRSLSTSLTFKTAKSIKYNRNNEVHLKRKKQNGKYYRHPESLITLKSL